MSIWDARQLRKIIRDNTEALAYNSLALGANTLAIRDLIWELRNGGNGYGQITEILKHIEETQLTQTLAIADIAMCLADLKFRFHRVGPMSVTITGEIKGVEGMADTILFEVNLPTLADPNDVEKRELQVHVDDVLQNTVSDIDPAETVVADQSAPQDSAVRLELRDIDDAGNVSEPSIHEFVAADTVAPPAPGALGVTITGENIEP